MAVPKPSPLFICWLSIFCLQRGMTALCLYLEDVTLCELKGACSDVDTFACLNLNAVDTFVAVVIVHWIVWRQKNSFVVRDCRSTLRCKKTNTKTPTWRMMTDLSQIFPEVGSVTGSSMRVSISGSRYSAGMSMSAIAVSISTTASAADLTLRRKPSKSCACSWTCYIQSHEVEQHNEE